MHIVTRSYQISRGTLINQLRLIATPEKMPPVAMSPIKALRIGPKQPLHSRGQVGLRCFYNKVEMIAHQTIGVHLPPGFAASLAERKQKLVSILVIEKNCFAPITPTHNVIARAFVLNAQGPRHRLARYQAQSKSVNCDSAEEPPVLRVAFKSTKAERVKEILTSAEWVFEKEL